MESLKLHHSFRQENKIEDHLASLWRLSLKRQLHAIMSRRVPSWKYSNLIMDWEQKLGLPRRDWGEQKNISGVPFRVFFFVFCCVAHPWADSFICSLFYFVVFIFIVVQNILFLKLYVLYQWFVHTTFYFNVMIIFNQKKKKKILVVSKGY